MRDVKADNGLVLEGPYLSMVPEDRVVEVEERHESDAVAPIRRMQWSNLPLRAPHIKQMRRRDGEVQQEAVIRDRQEE